MEKSGYNYDFLMSVINDAKKKESMEYYSKYYQCAKFIQIYHTSNYKYKKNDICEKTCCKTYPKICGGKCCSSIYWKCQCNIIPDKYKKVDNCYDDCCAIYLIKPRRKFTITWL
jgi:hypothetical protein